MCTDVITPRYDESTIASALNEFLDISDDNADSWLAFLLESWIGSDAIDRTDAEMRATMMRNLNAVVDLVRTVQESHRYHYATSENA